MSDDILSDIERIKETAENTKNKVKQFDGNLNSAHREEDYIKSILALLIETLNLTIETNSKVIELIKEITKENVIKNE